MTDFFTIAEKFGPWVAMIVMMLYIAANKLWPEWLVTRREERKLEVESEKQDRASLAAVYERFIAQQEQTLKFVASETEAIHSFVRSLDGNTQQLFHLTQMVEHGPSCPLPDCPFMDKHAKTK
jgi:hypothetical protein